MDIRKSTLEDLDEIMVIFDIAREYMNNHGNPTQWISGYPSRDILQQDILNQNNYVIIHQNQIVGTFSFIIGEEPTYAIIEDGNWRSKQKYGTIHRIASKGTIKGISKKCFEYCLQQIPYLRIDTHHDNKSMQSAIRKFGFKECGHIYVSNGSKRIAYDYLKE